MIVVGRDVLAAIETQRLLSPELDEITKLESGGSTSLAEAPVQIRSSRRMLTKELERGVM
jgi:hypothetical protein